MNIIKKYKILSKSDQLILVLLFNTILNLIIAIAKYVLAITIPSLWFGVNAGFGFILAFTRFQTIKDYRRIKLLQSKEEKDKAEYTNFLRNGILLILLDTYAENYNSSINGYTGMGVSLVIIFLGIYMIFKITIMK